MTETPRIVITGFGIRCPFARTYPEFGEALFTGQTCIGPLEGWDIADPRFCLGGQVKDFDIGQEMPEVDAKRILRFSQFALVAAKGAVADAGLDQPALQRDRIGTAFSTAVAGAGDTFHVEGVRFLKRGDRGVSPAAWSEYTSCACTTHVAIHFGFRGPVATLSAGCVSGIDAIVWAVQQIRAEKADVMIAGGADAPFFPLLWAAMYRSGILAPAPEDGRGIPRPFSHDHNGIALVEGGSAVILERESHARLRGARIYGELVGVSSVEEARPLTDLDPSGLAYALTIQRALHDAGLPPSAIDWVCAHGTGYPGADRAESQGIETALGDHAFCVPVSSIRGAVGQSFASGGVFQLAAACQAIARHSVPPTLNFSAPAEDCRLDYVPNVARVARVQRAVINAAGIGGTHAGLVIAAYAG